MFSKELQELDEGTTQYMIDELADEVEELRSEVSELKDENTNLKSELQRLQTLLASKNV